MLIAPTPPYVKYIIPEKLNALRAELMANEKLLAVDPQWHYLLARIGVLLRDPEPQFVATVMRGLRLFPGYSPLIGAGTDYFLPKWDGNGTGLQKWAAVADDDPAARGSGTYARIHVHAFEVQYGQALFGQSGIDWTRFKASADDWLKITSHPEVLSEVAVIACLAGDRGETRRMFTLGKELLNPRAWGGAANRDACKAWSEMSEWQALLAAGLDSVNQVLDLVVNWILRISARF